MQFPIPDEIPEDIPKEILDGCKFAVRKGWAETELEWYQILFTTINMYAKELEDASINTIQYP